MRTGPVAFCACYFAFFCSIAALPIWAEESADVILSKYIDASRLSSATALLSRYEFQPRENGRLMHSEIIEQLDENRFYLNYTRTTEAVKPGRLPVFETITLKNGGGTWLLRPKTKSALRTRKDSQRDEIKASRQFSNPETVLRARQNVSTTEIDGDLCYVITADLPESYRRDQVQMRYKPGDAPVSQRDSGEKIAGAAYILAISQKTYLLKSKKIVAENGDVLSDTSYLEMRKIATYPIDHFDIPIGYFMLFPDGDHQRAIALKSTTQKYFDEIARELNPIRLPGRKEHEKR